MKLSGSPGLPSLGAINPQPPVVTTRKISRHGPMSPRGQNRPRLRTTAVPLGWFVCNSGLYTRSNGSLAPHPRLDTNDCPGAQGLPRTSHTSPPHSSLGVPDTGITTSFFPRGNGVPRGEGTPLLRLDFTLPFSLWFLPEQRSHRRQLSLTPLGTPPDLTELKNGKDSPGGGFAGTICPSKVLLKRISLFPSDSIQNALHLFLPNSSSESNTRRGLFGVAASLQRAQAPCGFLWPPRRQGRFLFGHVC